MFKGTQKKKEKNPGVVASADENTEEAGRVARTYLLYSTQQSKD